MNFIWMRNLLRFYYLNEIDEIVNKYFDVVEVYGDFDMSEYSQEKSRRFIVVLKRK